MIKTGPANPSKSPATGRHSTHQDPGKCISRITDSTFARAATADAGRAAAGAAAAAGAPFAPPLLQLPIAPTGRDYGKDDGSGAWIKRMTRITGATGGVQLSIDWTWIMMDTLRSG